MVKRKARDLENRLSAEEPRRSSRRISILKDEAPEQTPKPTVAKRAKKTKESDEDTLKKVNGTGKEATVPGSSVCWVILLPSLSPHQLLLGSTQYNLKALITCAITWLSPIQPGTST
jgi:hypothetical protein